MDTLLRFDHIDICFDGQKALEDVSIRLHPREILGIVGESGSGKTSLIKAAIGLLGKGGLVTRGDIWYQGKSIPDMKQRELRQIRGKEIAMIFQDCGASLCPIRSIGAQIHEALNAHGRFTKAQAKAQGCELLNKLGFQDVERIWKSYPFELSGGMNQRVGIAIAMLHKPPILLADEPTSALDVAVQKQVVEEMLNLRDLFGTAIILVTHDIGVVSAMADSVLVMQNGKMVEYGPAKQILAHPQEDYTKALLSAVPTLRRV